MLFILLSFCTILLPLHNILFLLFLVCNNVIDEEVLLNHQVEPVAWEDDTWFFVGLRGSRCLSKGHASSIQILWQNRGCHNYAQVDPTMHIEAMWDHKREGQGYRYDGED
jgi:hypothetical protein